jgi:hypothetical protein
MKENLGKHHQLFTDSEEAESTETIISKYMPGLDGYSYPLRL